MNTITQYLGSLPVGNILVGFGAVLIVLVLLGVSLPVLAVEWVHRKYLQHKAAMAERAEMSPEGSHAVMGMILIPFIDVQVPDVFIAFVQVNWLNAVIMVIALLAVAVYYFRSRECVYDDDSHIDKAWESEAALGADSTPSVLNPTHGINIMLTSGSLHFCPKGGLVETVENDFSDIVCSHPCRGHNDCGLRS